MCINKQDKNYFDGWSHWHDWNDIQLSGLFSLWTQIWTLVANNQPEKHMSFRLRLYTHGVVCDSSEKDKNGEK